MARKTIRVDIPYRNPDKFIELAQSILKYYADGQNEKLDAARIHKLTELTEVAASNHTDSKNLDAQAQAARQRRDTALGIADGQNAATPDTILNLVNYVRDELLLQYAGNEEVLQQYGFDVVIGTAKSPSRNHTTAATT
ncbi:MAG TPA: hypothetical protein VL171_03035 [Verrucomicrobiae bacterium]|nr:hypothetical protein [Verrucomicrobiae bacterium]